MWPNLGGILGLMWLEFLSFDVARSPTHDVHQTRACIRPDVGLHAKVPLIALLAGVHVRVACFVFGLGGGGCCNQGGIHDGTCLQKQASLGQQFIASSQNLLSEFVFLQSVPEAQDGGLVG